MAKSRRTRSRRRRRVSKILGGAGGATQHAINTYGGIGEQHAGVGNVIAVHPTQTGGLAQLSPATVVTGGAPLSPALVTGGAPLSPAEIKGGGIITDIALPAALIYTRNVISRRSSSKKSRRHHRRVGGKKH